MVKKTQSIEGKHPTFLAFSHPDWFLPYVTQQKRIFLACKPELSLYPLSIRVFQTGRSLLPLASMNRYLHFYCPLSFPMTDTSRLFSVQSHKGRQVRQEKVWGIFVWKNWALFQDSLSYSPLCMLTDTV